MLYVNWAGRPLRLYQDGSAFDEVTRSLWVADLHLGKDASFRHAGVPVPDGPTQKTLLRLSAAVRATDADRVVIVGDMLHDRASWSNSTITAWQQWQQMHADTAVTLVRGNHDRRAANVLDEIGVEITPESWRFDGVEFRHEPPGHPPREPAVSGHLHPGYAIREPGGGGIVAACFWMQPRQLVLPAFGAFTGYARITPAKEDRIFMLIEGDILELPKALIEASAG